MNKIYRVVWNASTGAWVAVSETAKSKTKSRSKKVVAAGLASVVLALSSNVFAAASTGGTGSGTVISSCTPTTGSQPDKAATGGSVQAVTIGCGAATNNDSTSNTLANRLNPYNSDFDTGGRASNSPASGSVAVGHMAQTEKTHSIAIGGYAHSTQVGSIAIGTGALSAGNTSLAVGRQSAATADYAQALGNVSAATGKGSLAVGHSATATGYRAIAIGSPDIENAGSSGSGQTGTNYQTTGQTKATAQDSIAFGGGAQATANNALSIGAFSQATAEKSVAIGTGAAATAANAVVIGEGANTNVAGGVALGLNAQVIGVNSAALGLNSVAAAQTGSAFLTNTAATTQGTVSFGNTTIKRRLTNLADGAAASDAVTVAQLQKQNDLSNQQGVDTAAALGGGSKYNASTGGITAPSYSVGGTTVGNVGAAISNVDARTTANSSNITTLQNQTFKIQANKDTATAVGANDTITFADGNNINITRTGNTISVATSATPTFTTVTSTGAASIGGTLTVTGATTVGGTLTTTGVANLNGGASLNGNRLTNVGAATAGTDAVNLNQLNTAIAGAGSGNADALGTSVATSLGGGATYNKTTGTIDKLGYVLDDGTNAGTTTTYNNVGDALGNLNDRTTANTTDIADLASGKTGLVQQASNTAQITVGAGTGGTSVNFVNDKGGDRQLTGIASAGDYTLAGNANNAVNAGDLNSAIGDVTTVVTNKGLNFTATDATAGVVNKKLGETLTIQGGITDTTTVTSGENVITRTDSKGNINVELAKNAKFDSVTADDGIGNDKAVFSPTGTYVRNGNANEATYGAAAVQLSDRFGNSINITKGGLDFTDTNGDATGPSIKVGGIDAGNKQITRVGSAGDITKAVNAGNAVNAGDVNAAITTLNATLTNTGFNITSDGESATNPVDTVKLGESIKYTNDDGNLVANHRDNEVVYDLADDINVDSVTAVGTPGNKAEFSSSGTYVRNDNGNEATYGAAAVQLSDRFGNSINITKGGLDFTDTNGDATGPSIKVGGIDAGSKQITQVASAGALTKNNTNAANGADVFNAVADAKTALTNAGFNITSNGSLASDNVKLGETVNFTNTDGNLVVSHTNNAVNYNLADNVTVDSLTANDGKGNVSTVTATGTNVTDGTNTANYAATGITLTNAAGKDTILESTGLTIDGGPSITVDGIDADGKIISNVADGTKATDAVNLGQLNTATAAVDAKTDTLGASTAASLGGGATYNKTTGTIDKLGYVLDDGTNAGTTTTYNNVGDALGNIDARTTTNTADIADLASGKAGLVQQASNTAQITVGAGTGGTSVNFANDKNEARQLTNVANGNVAAGSTDAVTGDQLNSNAQSVTDLIGGNAINKAGVITTTNIGGTGKNTIDGAIDSVRQAANAGWNVTANGTGSTTSNIGPNGTVTFNGDSNLTVTQNGKDDNGSVNVALNKDISINTITADDGKGNSTVLSTDGTYVTNAAGSAARYNADGITVTDAAGSSTVVNQAGVSFTDSKGNATGPSVSAGGINAGGQRITNLADGTALDDAVTVGQALNAAQSLGDSVATNLGGGAVYNPATGTVTAPTYTLDDGSNTGTTADFNNVGDALTNLDGRTTTNTADIADLTSSLNNGTIGLVQQANNTAEITVGKDSLGTSISFANANGEARQLTNVAAGSIAAGSTDAINGDQLNSSTQSVADVIGGNATNNGGVITTTNIGGTGENTIDGAIDNVRQAASANDAKTDALGTSTAANLGGGATYDKTTGSVSAPDYVLDDGSNTGTTTTYNNVGDALGNIDARTTTNTADIADLTSSLNNGTIGLVQQANNTASITVGKDSLGTTIDFANANGEARQLTNVANGNVAAGSTDAVTGDQLNSNAQSVTDLIGGNAVNNNGSVSASNIGGTGENTIDGAIDNVRQSTQDLSAGAVQYDRNLDGSVNYDRVTLNGNNGTVLGNVGSGEISASSTEAVNGSQIHAANTSIANALGGNATLNTDGTVSAPTYTLDDGSNTGTTADFNNVGDALTNLDGRTTTNTADIADLASNINNGTIGLVQQANNTAEITVGKDSLGTSISFANANGEARQLTNVANGIDATDAANMQQLKDLTTALGGNIDPNTGVIIAPEYTVNNYSIDPNTGMMIVTPSVVNNVGDALNSIGGQINNLQTSDVGIKYFRTNSTQSDAVALGEDSIAIGPVSAAQQQGNRTISMGVDASSAADSAIAIGDGANIAQDADQSIAIGNNAQVNGEQSISIGTGNIVNGDRSGAIGDPSIINGNDSYSVGNNNTVNSDDTFVLGNNVTTTVDGSVALGSNSAATTGAGVAGYALQVASAADKLAIAATTSTTGAVAVGDAANGVYRQITGVAAGTEDSDAVNLAQLKAVDNALANLTSGIGNGSIGLVQQVGTTAPITVGAATGGTIVNFAGTDGNRQLTGVAASGQNNAAATVGQIRDMASALGGGAAVNANGTLTAPTYNVQGGTQNNVGDALGALDTALNDVKNANQSLSNAAVQYDKNADGTVNKGQITLGGGADGTTLTNVKDGALTAGSKDAVNGGQLYETNQQVSNLASQINNGSVGLVQQAGNTAQVTVAANTGGTSVSMAGTSGNRTVTGVKAGAVTATSSDAINGAQLHASNTSVANALGGGAAVDASGNITAPSYQVAGETATNVGDALTKLDNQSNALSNRLDQAFYRTNERIDKVEKRANAGIAAALSMESAPFVPGKFTYSVGAGFHGGENAVGATLRRTSDSGRWSLTGGVATASEGGASARIGISGIID